MVALSIRKIVRDDVHFINQHWKDTTDEDLVRLGELGRPDPEENVKFTNWFCSTLDAPIVAGEDIRIWCADGETVGYSSLKDFQPGLEGQIHLHMARPHWRKGFGSVLFCLSAQDFLTTFELKRLYCQPKSDNPMPNGMLQKIGFRMVGTIDFKRKDGSCISQSRYNIEPKVIKRCLVNAKGHFKI